MSLQYLWASCFSPASHSGLVIALGFSGRVCVPLAITKKIEMENTPQDIFATPSENPNGIPLEDISPPHFDEEAIQHAQPAVPLAEVKARRFWPFVLVLLCGSAVLGAVMAIALSGYHTTSKQVSAPAANVAPYVPAQSEPEASRSFGEPKDQPADVRPDAAERKTETTRGTVPRESTVASAKPISDAPTDDRQNSEARTTLEGALNEWLAATNARDIARQMDFYNPTVNAFYLKRSVPREVVHAEKSRVFAHANLVNIKAARRDIQVSRDGRTATMRFRKKYAIEGGDADRRGEVLQELRWRRTSDGWKIVSERDLRVIH